MLCPCVTPLEVVNHTLIPRRTPNDSHKWQTALIAGVALAGSFQDAESALRGVYGKYRVALFATNAGNAAKSAEAIAAFDKGWSEVSGQIAAAPQYADDGAVPATLAAVAAHTAKAAEAVAAGNLLEAQLLAEKVGVLACWANKIATHPAPEAADPAYQPLTDAFQASVAAMQQAVRSGDAAAVKAALAG